MSEPIKLVSATILESLARSQADNLQRYISGDFTDLARENGWEIETTLARWDPKVIAELDPSVTPAAEIKNSLLIYRAFTDMTPALARDERLWARLCHVEGLEFSRRRWLRRDETLANQVRLHFFAQGIVGCRDNNAIGRLWWNGHVASLASPDNLESALELILSRANIRKQIIDRADTAFRQPLISGIVRLLGVEPWFNTYDAAIADFMYEVNKRSGGAIFEALPEDVIDSHLVRCVSFAKARRGKGDVVD